MNRLTDRVSHCAIVVPRNLVILMNWDLFLYARSCRSMQKFALPCCTSSFQQRQAPVKTSSRSHSVAAIATKLRIWLRDMYVRISERCLHAALHNDTEKKLYLLLYLNASKQIKQWLPVLHSILAYNTSCFKAHLKLVLFMPKHVSQAGEFL